MGRSLVQAKQSRSNTEVLGPIGQGTVKTAVRENGTGLARRASGHVRQWHARSEAELRAGSFGRAPCLIDDFARAWRVSADPVADLLLLVCPRESDATADIVRDRLHGLP